MDGGTVIIIAVMSVCGVVLVVFVHEALAVLGFHSAGRRNTLLDEQIRAHPLTQDLHRESAARMSAASDNTNRLMQDLENTLNRLPDDPQRRRVWPVPLSPTPAPSPPKPPALRPRPRSRRIELRDAGTA